MKICGYNVISKFIKKNFILKKENVIKSVFLSVLLCSIVFSAGIYLYMKSSVALDFYNNRVNVKKESPKKVFLLAWKIAQKNYIDPSLNHQNWGRWKKRYANVIKTDEDTKVAIDSMLASLDDPYTKYMDFSQYKEQNTSIDAKIVGIGVNVTAIAGKTIIENTPAQKVGLKPEDIISKVNNRDINGFQLDDVVALIRGKIGTSVDIQVIRKNKKLNFKIKRDEIKIHNVISRRLGKNIGYIQIISFIGEDVYSEFETALDKFRNTNGLIIDVRSNPGGLLPNALYIANLFINEGDLVSLVKRNGATTTIKAEPTQQIYEKPIVILVDSNSASASEILSGALKDHKKAVLVGQKTFGKGVIQKIFPMPCSTGMNLTTGKYLTPSRMSINKIGIKPDYVVPLDTKIYLKSGDVQLEKAVQILSLK